MTRPEHQSLPYPIRFGILRTVLLLWNEFRQRAIAFSKDRKGEIRQAPEHHTFHKATKKQNYLHRRLAYVRLDAKMPSEVLS